MSPVAHLTETTVVHHRRLQVDRAFRHRVFHLLVDVEELDDVESRIRGFGRRGPVAIRPEDHFGPTSRPLREKVAAWVAGQGGELGDGPLLLWTYPRMFGHVFNPVSWWWSYRRDGSLAMVIAEVNNTFGDWHAYLLRDFERRGHALTARREKVFHVSPFLPTNGLRYQFTLRPPDLAEPTTPVSAHLALLGAGDHVVFEASQHGTPQPLDTSSLWRAVLTHPMVGLVTLIRIHRQAVGLWRRRVSFFRRPEPPPTGLDAAEPVVPQPVGGRR